MHKQELAVIFFVCGDISSKLKKGEKKKQTRVRTTERKNARDTKWADFDVEKVNELLE